VAKPDVSVPRTVFERDTLTLAPYAMHSAASAGRKYAEAEHPFRGPYQRDRDRVVHSGAFRRLSAKTQVFTGDLGDYHRTRLTHTHEVAGIARTLGRTLALNEDLIETLALVHDLGHPPFGHAGEDVLDECLRDHGGFSHNAQALRIVELLERRYPDFPGLNLSLEVLEGQHHRARKHEPAKLRPLLEVQVVDAADSIAYDTHDADDALELGLLTIDDLLQTRLWAHAASEVKRRYADLRDDELRRAVLRELIDCQVRDLIDQAFVRIKTSEIESTQSVRQADLVVAPSKELAEWKNELEELLFGRVYRHPEVLAHRAEAQELLRAMFAGLIARPDLMSERFRDNIAREGLERSVADYLSGMTDRFAHKEFERIRS
jgi:dGTPase